MPAADAWNVLHAIAVEGDSPGDRAAVTAALAAPQPPPDEGGGSLGDEAEAYLREVVWGG